MSLDFQPNKSVTAEPSISAKECLAHAGDPTVYAILTPLEHLARDACRLEYNKRFFCEATVAIATKPGIGSRDPTPAPQQSLPPAEEHLFLSLNNRDIKQRGIVKFGTNPHQNDCLLGYRGTNAISSTHFLIILEQDFKIRLKDESSWGTTVQYDGEERPEYDNYLAYCPGLSVPWEEVSIHLPNNFSFKIEFPNHVSAQPEYLKALRVFHQGDSAAGPLDANLQQLGLRSEPITEAPSQLQTPRQQTLYLDHGTLGTGVSSVVKRVTRANTGEKFAAKYFRRPHHQDREKWLSEIREEIRIMQDSPHENILEVIDYVESPSPVLITPLCLGNLDQFTFTEEQCVSIFRQILVVLDHLHKRRIMHRDLKPDNILFVAPCTIKLADFGSSKTVMASRLNSFCGTMLWAAPEIFVIEDREGYNAKSDIWSAGVIMLRLMYQFPEYPRKVKGDDIFETKRHSVWCKTLEGCIKELDEDDDTVVEILCRMVVIAVTKRFTAEMCLEKGCENGLFRRRRDGKIIGADDTEINTPVHGTPRSSAATNVGNSADETQRTPARQHNLGNEIRTPEPLLRSSFSAYQASRKRARLSSSSGNLSHIS